MKILLPVDGSDYTQRMLRYISEHDELLGPGHDYTAFTAVPPVPPNAARHVDRGTLEDYYRDQAEEVLAPVRALAEKQGWTIRTAYAPGHAAEAISTFAKNDKAGLIVMGSHGHAALRSVMLGSVASGVLARCQTPVLLIR